jgi:hypothetical protein
VLTIWVGNLCHKDFGAKAAHKMLVKLTPEESERNDKKSFDKFLLSIGSPKKLKHEQHIFKKFKKLEYPYNTSFSS